MTEDTERFNSKCKELDASWWLKYNYPLTIVNDRYGGAYSGGNFLAFPVHEYAVPAGHDSSDGMCMDFWAEVDFTFIGIGDTPNAAFEDLRSKLKEKINGH